MTREEFEEWLGEHGSTAVDNIEVDEADPPMWLKMYAKSLSNLLQEQMDEEDESDDEDEGEEALDEEDV